MLGTGFARRLITRMYFEGDPLIWREPMVLGIPDRAAAERLIAPLVLNATIPRDMLAYRFDIAIQTRLSFAADPVLNLIEPRSRRKTLLARRETREGATAYVLDIHLQGDDETVFFDV